MNRPVSIALLLVALLGTAGCFGAVEPEPIEEADAPLVLEVPTFEWITPLETQQLDGTPVVLQIRYSGEGWTLTPTVLDPQFNPLSAYGWSLSSVGYSLEFLPTMLGVYSASIAIEPSDVEATAPEVNLSLIHI